METPNKSVNQQQYDDIPPLETQREIYKELEEEKKLIVGEDVFLISVKWLQKFKHGTASTCGPIDNRCLISNGRISLENRREKLDYEIISKDMWETLYSWYQGGPTITFQVINTSIGPKVLLSFLKLKCYFKNCEPKDITTNEYARTKDLREQIMKMFNISLDEETRLWDYYQKDFRNEMKDENEIRKYNLIDNQEIYLDIKENGKWFKDTKTKGSSSFPEDTKAINSSICSEDTKAISSSICLKDIKIDELKNTCFLNVFVQCLLYNIPLMKSIIISKKWDNDIKGTHLNNAKTFSELMKFVWSGENKTITLDRLKKMIEQYAPKFLQSNQDDPSSFFNDLLADFHKCLNRKNNKNSTSQSIIGSFENDSDFKRENDSIITDTFYGQFKTELICPNCGFIKASYEPYNIISLPKRSRDKGFKVTFVPLKYTDPYVKMKLEIPTNSSFSDISKKISEYLKKDVKVILGWYRIFDGIEWTHDNFNNYDEISQPHICAFEVENFDSYYIPCSLQMKEKNSIGYGYRFDLLTNIGKPFLLSFNHPDPTEEEISDCAYNYLKCLWDPNNEPSPSEYVQDIIKNGKYYSDSVDNIFSHKPIAVKIPFFYGKKINFSSEYPNLAKSFVHLYLNPLFIDNEKMPKFSYCKLYCHLKPKKEQPLKEFLLKDCFSSLFGTETMESNDKWNCSICQKYVCANIKNSLWTVPDSLIIDLEKYSDKDLFKYDIELDLTDLYAGENADGKKILYRLSGVIECSDENCSKKYTSHVRVVQPGNMNEKWYFFDNSDVSEVDEQSAINKSARFLFYQRIIDDE